MKHVIRILLLAVALVTGLTTVSAQQVVVVVRQKVHPLPATATNYLDDPFHYFDIQCNLIGAAELDVFFDVEFSVNTMPFYVRTKPGSVPKEPIHLKEGPNSIGKDEIWSQFRSRQENNIDLHQPVSALLLPEGTYQLCVDVYLWSDKDNPNRESIRIGDCPTYIICYSGSAPEMVSPMAGAQMALNGAMVVSPARKIKFFWTPVISNCADASARFKYKLKVVKVLSGQNYRDAIKHNPTVFSAEVRDHNFAVYDTLRDIKVHMERGALYVAQVQAEQIKTSRSTGTFVVANDGNSQPMPFYWCYSSDGYEFDVDDEEEEGDDEEGEDGLTRWSGGVEELSELDEILEEAFPEEGTVVIAPKRHYVESDGYYTIPMTDDIEVGLKSAQHQSLKDISYELALYENRDGDVDSITAYEPLFSEKFSELPETRVLEGWGTKLEQGSLYYLQLSSSYTVGYSEYSIADTNFYVNGYLADHIHDTISREYKEEEQVHSEGIFFQWGNDPDTPAFKTPQWTAPVDRSSDDIYDPANYQLPTAVPEVRKAKTFPVSWVPVKNVAKGDTVEYEVNVYELRSGQTPEEAVSENEVLITRMVNTNEIPETDKEFFKVFSSKKTYVMTLSTMVDGESDTVYHFENGNESIPVVFKIVK